MTFRNIFRLIYVCHATSKYKVYWKCVNTHQIIFCNIIFNKINIILWPNKHHVSLGNAVLLIICVMKWLIIVLVIDILSSVVIWVKHCTESFRKTCWLGLLFFYSELHSFRCHCYLLYDKDLNFTRHEVTVLTGLNYSANIHTPKINREQQNCATTKTSVVFLLILYTMSYLDLVEIIYNLSFIIFWKNQMVLSNINFKGMLRLLKIMTSQYDNNSDLVV